MWRYSLDVFFDVGANDGETAIRARHDFGRCRIIAFEPHPKTFEQLRDKTKTFTNVEIHNLAFSSEIGERTMFEFDHSKLNSLLPDAQSVVFHDKRADGQIRVNCTTIDKFCSDLSIEKIDILKIDTEGFELEVLRGAISMLAHKAIKFIYFEINDIAPRSGASGGALAPIDQLIRTHGYRFIATYTDFVIPKGELFLCSNALYALPPSHRK